MNYFKERQAYRKLLTEELSLSLGQNVLFRELLDYANDEGKMDDHFRLRNSVLASRTSLTEQGLAQARNRLVQVGLIEYTPGKKDKTAPEYKLVKLYKDFAKDDGNSLPASYQPVVQVVGSSVDQPVEQSTLQLQDSYKTNKPSRAKSDKRTFAPDSDELQAATKLWTKITANNPETKTPNLQRWADDLRLMHERDNRSWDKINRMIEWSQADAFWSGVILSAKKLREKYDQMAAKANAEAREAAQPKTYGKPARVEAKPGWLDKPYQPSNESEDPALNEEIAAKLKHLQELREKDEKGSKTNADTKTMA